MTENEKLIVLRAVVTGWLIAEKPFTSVELCNHMKRLGIWIRNRDVAEYLRSNVEEISNEFGVYVATTMIGVDASKNATTAATLYHPERYDADNYMSRDLKAITPGEFEAMHGVSPFDNVTIAEPKPVITPDKKGGFNFHFPTSK